MVRTQILIVSVLAAACLPYASSDTCKSLDLKVSCDCPGGCISMATSCYCDEAGENGRFALFGDLNTLSANGPLGGDNFVDGGADLYLW